MRAEGDHIRRVGSPRGLRHVDLGVGDAVHRRVVAVAALPDGQDASVVRVAQARDARHKQAQQHRLGAIRVDLAEAAVIDVLRVAREVGARSPERGGTAAAHQRLEACNGVGHDLLDRAGAVEGPLRVQAGSEAQALGLDAPLQGPAVGRGVAVLLHAVLDALHPDELQGLPHARIHVGVGTRNRGLRLEKRLDLGVLLCAARHVESNGLVEAPLLLRLPQATQILRPEAQPLLRLETLLRDEPVPRVHQVHRRIRSTHRGIQQARQAVVLHERLHVVPVALAREASAKRAAIGRVVEQASVGLATAHQIFDVLAPVLVVLVVGAVAQDYWHTLRQPTQHRVPVDEQRRPCPQARLPQSHHEHTTF
mmetsp:Transcript_45749/g.131180  ORF Transcript_45749/g.131180 Transcript_45749/m.131180 type:complete len:366 (-) Transcript_45749:303-1400(-)